MPKNTSKSEHLEQCIVIDYRNKITLDNPAHPLRLLYAIPNGGLRDPIVAAQLENEGVTRGIPDLHLPVSRGGWHGLYIELKRTKGGRISKEQREKSEDLIKEGNLVIFCYGAEDTIRTLENYLAGLYQRS